MNVKALVAEYLENGGEVKKGKYHAARKSELVWKQHAAAEVAYRGAKANKLKQAGYAKAA